MKLCSERGQVRKGKKMKLPVLRNVLGQVKPARSGPHNHVWFLAGVLLLASTHTHH